VDRSTLKDIVIFIALGAIATVINFAFKAVFADVPDLDFTNLHCPAQVAFIPETGQVTIYGTRGGDVMICGSGVITKDGLISVAHVFDNPAVDSYIVRVDDKNFRLIVYPEEVAMPDGQDHIVVLPLNRYLTEKAVLTPVRSLYFDQQRPVYMRTLYGAEIAGSLDAVYYDLYPPYMRSTMPSYGGCQGLSGSPLYTQEKLLVGILTNGLLWDEPDPNKRQCSNVVQFFGVTAEFVPPLP